MKKENLAIQALLVILDKWDHQDQTDPKEKMAIQVYQESRVPLALLEVTVQREVEDPEGQGVYQVTQDLRGPEDQQDSEAHREKMEEMDMDRLDQRDTRETLGILAFQVWRAKMGTKGPVELKVIRVTKEDRGMLVVQVTQGLKEKKGWMDTWVKKEFLEPVQCLNVTWLNIYVKTVLAARVMVPGVQFTRQTW